MSKTLKQECANEGNYPTVDEMKEMMRKNISLSLYFQRIRHGWSKHKAKNKPPQNHHHPVQKNRGKEKKSKNGPLKLLMVHLC